MKHRSIIAIALIGAIAFSSVAHAKPKPKKLKPPKPAPTLVRATPINDYANAGLEIAIIRGWVKRDGPFAVRLRMAIAELRTSDISQAALKTGVKVEWLSRLINVGMAPTNVAATPESQKTEVTEYAIDDEDF
ncbi:MAG: hypothetical protein ACRC62_19215 [Microcoleus sp.]